MNISVKSSQSKCIIRESKTTKWPTLMKAKGLKPDKILHGPIFPEPVQIVVFIPIGNALKPIANGFNTFRKSEPVLTLDQLTAPETTTQMESFDREREFHNEGCHKMIRFVKWCDYLKQVCLTTEGCECRVACLKF